MTIAKQIIEKLGIVGINLPEIIRLYKTEDVDKDAKQIILAYYEALGNSSEFEDGDNNKERLIQSIQYYTRKYDQNYLYNKYVKLEDFLD